MTYILVAIFAGITGAFLMYLSKQISQKSTYLPQTYTFAWAVIGSITFLPIAIISHIEILNDININSLIWLVFAGLAFGLGNIFSFKAFKNVDISAHTIAFRLNIILTILAGIFIFDEQLTNVKYAGVFAILIGILVLISPSGKRLSFNKKIMLSLTAAVFSAIAVTCTKLAQTNGINFIIVAFANYFFQIPFVISPKTLSQTKEMFTNRKILSRIILVIFLIPISWGSTVFSYKGNLSIVQPTMQIVQLIVTVGLGIFILGEKDSILKKSIGTFLGIIGIILICT